MRSLQFVIVQLLIVVMLVLTAGVSFARYTLDEYPTPVWDSSAADRFQPEVAGGYQFQYGDTETVVFNLPWSFPYYDIFYTQITADTDGNIWFGAVGSSPRIAVWNADFDSYYSGGLFIQHRNSPDRVVVHWQTDIAADAGYGRTNNFSAVLYPDGTIQLNYKDISPFASEDNGSGFYSGKKWLYLPVPVPNITSTSYAYSENTDGDGISAVDDNCPAVANADQADVDGDGFGDACDDDSDNDGVIDTLDYFPYDPSEWADFDLDGTGDNADTDDDDDGVSDVDDAFPLDAGESVDTDGDGVGNNADNDDDNDGVLDNDDAFPLDRTESVDSDGDGIGNNADIDDDNDGILDGADPYPLIPLARAGELDPFFAGTDLENVYSLAESISKITQQPDGKFVVVGAATSSDDTDFFIARYDAAGSLDPSFASGAGYLVSSLRDSDVYSKVFLLDDGRILVIGSTYTFGTGSDTIFARYNADGTPDFSFGGGDGMVLLSTDLGLPIGSAYASALQADAKIIITDISSNIFRINPDGSADTLFGGGSGYVANLLAGEAVNAEVVSVESDGRLFVVGRTTGDRVAFARYDSDGSLDLTYGQGTGYVFNDFIPTGNSDGIIQQADGKIVAFGDYTPVLEEGDFALARYNYDGSRDITFSVDGQMRSSLDGSGHVWTLNQQADGKLFIAGYRQEADGTPLLATIARYNVDGSLDTGFGGGDGLAQLPNDGAFNGIWIQSDGQIIARGYDAEGPHLKRFNAGIVGEVTINGDAKETSTSDVSLDLPCLNDGAPCTEMRIGYDGISWSDWEVYASNRAENLPDAQGTLSSIYVQYRDEFDNYSSVYKDEIFYGAYAAPIITGQNPLVVPEDSSLVISLADLVVSAPGRVVPDDLSFSVSDGANYSLTFSETTGISVVPVANFNGTLSVPVGVSDDLASSDVFDLQITVSPINDAPSIGGVSETRIFPGAYYSFTPTVSDIDGDLLTFSIENKPAWATFDTATGQLSGTPQVADVAYYSDIKITVGDVVDSTLLSPFDLDVRGLSPGELDPDFSGGAGFIETPIISYFQNNEIVVQPDGKILVGGTYGYGSFVPVIARFLQTGVLDSSFGGGNGYVLSMGGSGSFSGLAIQGDGKIVATRSLNDGSLNLERYNPDGSIDSSFNGVGTVTVSGYGFGNTDVQIQEDGKILVLSKSSQSGLSVSKFNVDGSVDTSFGTGNGYINIGPLSYVSSEYKLLLGENGKVLIVLEGTVDTNDPYYEFKIFKLNQDGTNDSLFGTDGLAVNQFPGWISGLYQVDSAVQEDGKILVLGTTYDGRMENITIIRYNFNGTLDEYFGSSGVIVTDLQSMGNFASAIDVQDDGKIVVGCRSYIFTQAVSSVVRYETDGNLDLTFGGGDGVVNFQAELFKYIDDVKVLPDGKIIAIGGDGYPRNQRLVRIIAGLVGTINIDGDDTIYNDPNVNLSLSCIDDGNACAEMNFSNDGINWSSWEPFASTKQWTLSSGYGPKNVFVKYQSTMGLESSVYSDSTNFVEAVDSDNDGFFDALDNCPSNANADQLNFDNDSLGDVCDSDDDNDGMPDSWETSYGLNPFDALDAIVDTDSDSLSSLDEYLAGTDPTNSDSDSDTILDGFDHYPMTAAAITLDHSSILANQSAEVLVSIDNLIPVGGNVSLEQIADLDGDGAIDAGEPEIRRMVLSDGDADGVISSTIGMLNTFAVDHAPGSYLIRVTSDGNELSSPFTVDPVSQPQTLQGRVTDGVVGVAGVQLELVDKWQRPVAWAITDLNGDYLFNIVQPGDYRLKPQKAGYAFDASLELLTTVPASSATAAADVVLSVGSYDVSGQVMAGLNDLAGVLVVASGSSGTTYRASALTAVDGSYQLGLPIGDYTITVPAGPYAGLSEHDVLADPATDITLSVGGHLVGIDFVLPTATVTISGDIVDESAIPVTGMYAVASNAGEIVATSVSASDGSYHLPASSNDSYAVTLDPLATQTLGYVSPQIVVATLSSDLTGQGLAIHATDSWIAGSVVDEQSAPVAGLPVYLRSDDNLYQLDMLTAEDGSYHFATFGGSWHVRAATEAQGFLPATEQNSNVQPETIDFVAQLPPLELTIDAVVTPTETDTQILTGTMSEGATVSVSVDTSSVVSQVTYPTLTSWECTLSSLAEGANNITVTVDNGTQSVFEQTSITYNLVQSSSIAVQKALYWVLKGTLTVDATSDLGVAANLSVDGFGALDWDSKNSDWSKVFSGVSSNPGTITVSGPEGSVTTSVTLK